MNVTLGEHLPVGRHATTDRPVSRHYMRCATSRRREKPKNASTMNSSKSHL
jgi:hypothetical protein